MRFLKNLLPLMTLLAALAMGSVLATADYNPTDPPEPGVNFTLTAKCVPAGSASVSGGGTYAFGTSVRMSASGHTGYRFVQWEDENGGKVSDQQSFQFEMPVRDVTLTARYVYDPGSPAEPETPEFKNVSHIKFEVRPAGAGYFNSSYENDYEVGTEHTFTARANSSYKFVNWTRDGLEVGTSTTLKYTVPHSDHTLVANFEYDPSDPAEPGGETPFHRLNLRCNLDGAAGLSFSGGSSNRKEAEEGKTVNISCNVNRYYTFVNWTDEEGEEVSDTRNFTYMMPARNVTLTANFTYFYNPDSPQEPGGETPAGSVGENMVAWPRFGMYDNCHVQILCETPGSTIHYTVDGTNPTASSPVYTEPVYVSSNVTVKAIAYVDGMEDSPVTSFKVYAYHAATPRYSFEGRKINIKSDTPGATIRYTLDFTTPNEESEIYTEPLEPEENCRIKAYASKEGLTDSPVSLYVYRRSEHVLPAPKFMMNDEGKLAIIPAAPDAVTRYTTDGSDPDESSLAYTAPLTLTQECTVKAYSSHPDHFDSPIGEYQVMFSRTAAPEISVDGPTVTITCPDEEASLWYAVNDSVPERMTSYTGPFSMNHAGVIYAQARKEGSLPSETVSREVIAYRLTYMVDGALYKELELVYGAAITPEPDPVKEGHTFSGWDNVPETMPAHDVTVSGTFSVNSYTLTYLVDGEVYKEYTVQFGAAIATEPEPAMEGHTFSGWDDVPETMPAHDVTVSGTFSVNSYKLTYLVDGEFYKEQTVEFGAAITPEEYPVKEGHTFSGWDEVPETMPAHDVTVNGTFSVNSYTLTYMVDGELYKEYTVEFGASITPEPEPAMEGHSFSGWDNVPETMPAHDVTVSGWFAENSRSAKPTISYNGRYIAIECEDNDARILFAIDDPSMTEPKEYEREFDAGGLHAVSAFTMKDGCNPSEATTFEILAYSDDTHAETAQPGILASAFGWLGNDFGGITDYSFVGQLDEDDYGVIRGMKDLRHINLSDVASTSMPDGALAGMGIVSASLPSSAESYGEGIFSGNDGLCAIFANSQAAIPAEAFNGFRNPNLLLYASEGHVVADAVGWLKNIIVEGKINSLTLTDAEPYFCPQEFEAKEVFFVKEFSKKTALGGCQGWESMAVPFNVTRIQKDDIILKPFADYTGDEATRPFWLYAPNGSGWERTAAMEAHHPYLISMPNCDAYEPSYNIAGDVTFIGGAQTIGRTPEPTPMPWKAGAEMWANFSRIPKAEGLLVVNDMEINGATGNFFEPGEHDVRPFECYVTSSAKKAIPIFDSSDVELLEENSIHIWSEGSDILIKSPLGATLRIYSLAGQLIRTIHVEAGVLHRESGLTPGIYFIADRKILVK